MQQCSIFNFVIFFLSVFLYFGFAFLYLFDCIFIFNAMISSFFFPFGLIGTLSCQKKKLQRNVHFAVETAIATFAYTRVAY